MVHQFSIDKDPVIRARKNHKLYGMGLGVMILDDVYPGFPGDVRNASGYHFPVQFEIIEGISIQKLVHDADKSALWEFRGSVCLLDSHAFDKFGNTTYRALESD